MCGHCAIKPSSTQYFEIDKATRVMAPLASLRDAVATLASIRGDRVWDLANHSRVD